MAVANDYVTGTITLTNGSTAFTGTGTAWRLANFRDGDRIYVDNLVAIIAPNSINDPFIDSNTSGKLTQPWTGTTGTRSYRMSYKPDGARVTAETRNLIELLGNGNLEAIAALTPTTNAFIRGNAGGTAWEEFTPTSTGLSLLSLAGTPNKALVTDGSGNPEQINLSTVGRLLLNLSGSNTDFVRGDGTLAAVLGTMASGALMETGINANGNYWRFRNGLQVTARSSGTVFINSANNALFVNGAAIGPYTLAATFASEPYEVITGHNLSGVGHCWVSSVNRPNTTQSSQMQLWRSTADATSQYFCRMIHIGSWN